MQQLPEATGGAKRTVETATQDEAVEKQEQPVCDACRAYGCKLQLPGRFSGTYFTYSVSKQEEKRGYLCILHYRHMDKDAWKCSEAVQQKVKARDFNFRGVWFPGDVAFSGELENADFIGACFGGAAHFLGASFKGSAYFDMAVFAGQADFSDATFGGQAYFTEATFHNRAIFRGLAKTRHAKRDPIDREVRLRFDPGYFDSPERICFERVDMAWVSLVGTDVRKVEFTNVDWPEELRDERVEYHPYPVLEKLYRQLRQNYEASGNYPDAGRFYYGEMEMRRKALSWPQRWLFSLTALYGISSGYGQRARQAGLWVVLLFLLFAGLYSWAGLQLQDASSAASHSPWAAFLHTGEVLTFARERTYKAANDFGRWLGVAQTIVLPLQVALLVLAVRRAFRR